MTALARVSEIKSGRRHHSKNYDGKPRPGTLIRQFYDDLRKGEIVAFGRKYENVRNQLMDFYGMDIEPVRDDRNSFIGSRLVGEWDGPYYIPVERIVSSLMEPA